MTNNKIFSARMRILVGESSYKAFGAKCKIDGKTVKSACDGIVPGHAIIEKIITATGKTHEWLFGHGPETEADLQVAENLCFLRKRREQLVDETSAKLSRDRFKMQCLGFFDELFDFVGDCYGENRDAVNDFLGEVFKSHANYRMWLAEKKEERRNRDDGSRGEKIAENGE